MTGSIIIHLYLSETEMSNNTHLQKHFPPLSKGFIFTECYFFFRALDKEVSIVLKVSVVGGFGAISMCWPWLQSGGLSVSALPLRVAIR